MSNRHCCLLASGYTNSASLPPSAFMCFVCSWTQHSFRTDETRIPKLVHECVPHNKTRSTMEKTPMKGGTNMMSYTTGDQTFGLGDLLYTQNIFRDLPQYRYASLNDGDTFCEMRCYAISSPCERVLTQT